MKRVNARRLPKQIDYSGIPAGAVIAALAVIDDQMSRYLFARSHWPEFAKDDEERAHELIWRRTVFDVFFRQVRERAMIEGEIFLAEARGERPSPLQKRTRTNAAKATWRDPLQNTHRYGAMIRLATDFSGAPALPHQGECARLVGLSRPSFCISWARVAKRIHSDLRAAYLQAERQFRQALLLG